MCPQIARMRRGKVTLVAFVWLISIVCFQMCPQWSWIRAYIPTRAALVQLLFFICRCHWSYHINIIFAQITFLNTWIHYPCVTTVLPGQMLISNCVKIKIDKQNLLMGQKVKVSLIGTPSNGVKTYLRPGIYNLKYTKRLKKNKKHFFFL